MTRENRLPSYQLINRKCERERQNISKMFKNLSELLANILKVFEFLLLFSGFFKNYKAAYPVPLENYHKTTRSLQSKVFVLE